jgi:hypothetical protein
LFDEYYNAIVIKTDKLYYNYVGINRKEFPKWEGWKIISRYKEDGIDIKDIRDERLDVLVRNFYYLRYLAEKFNQ